MKSGSEFTFHFLMIKHTQHDWLLDVLVKHNQNTTNVDFCPLIHHLLKSLYHQRLSYVSLLTSTKRGNVLNCVKSRRVIASRSSVDLCAHRRSERLHNQSHPIPAALIEKTLLNLLSTHLSLQPVGMNDTSFDLCCTVPSPSPISVRVHL